jgi:hypothetical protein
VVGENEGVAAAEENVGGAAVGGKVGTVAVKIVNTRCSDGEVGNGMTGWGSGLGYGGGLGGGKLAVCGFA